jgi:plastocyanin
MKRQSALLLPIVPVLALALAACGGGSKSSATPMAGTAATTKTAGGGTTLRLQADPSGALKFDKTSLEAPAGNVTIVMTNPSSMPHDIAIQGNGVDFTGNVVSDGGTSTVSADLQPGTYTFLCTVDSHAQAGMKGTLTVR